MLRASSRYGGPTDMKYFFHNGSFSWRLNPQAQENPVCVNLSQTFLWKALRFFWFPEKGNAIMK